MNKIEEEIKLKLAKSQAFLSEVDVLLKNKFYNTAINRLYYSCFHVTKALLLTKNLAPKSHSGVGILLQKEFVQKNNFEIGQASFFSKLMGERNETDYSDFLIADEDDVLEYFEPAKEYVQYTTALVNKYLDDENAE